MLDELLSTVIPNLERFPDMGRSFLAQPARSVETTNALNALCAKLAAQTSDPDALREYVLSDYLLLYVQVECVIYLLAFAITDSCRSTSSLIGYIRAIPIGLSAKLFFRVSSQVNSR